MTTEAPALASSPSHVQLSDAARRTSLPGNTLFSNNSALQVRPHNHTYARSCIALHCIHVD